MTVPARSVSAESATVRAIEGAFVLSLVVAVVDLGQQLPVRDQQRPWARQPVHGRLADDNRRSQPDSTQTTPPLKVLVLF